VERLSRRDLRALVEFAAGLHDRHELDGLADYVLGRLPVLVRSEVTAYNEINPRRHRILWRDEPSTATLVPDGRQAFERHMHEHPLIAHYQRTGYDGVMKISDFLTLRQFRRTGLYQEFFARFDGGDYQIVARLPALSPLVVGISLNRDRVDFTERDRLVMELVRPHVTQAYRTAAAVTGLRETLSLVGRGLDQLGRGLIVSTRDGRVRLATEQARRWLGEYLDPGGRPWAGRRLPERLQTWLRRQIAGLASLSDAPTAPEPLALAREDRLLVVRLVLEPGQCLLLLEERAAAAPARRLEACGLTRREAEVLAWVAEGKSNGEIGAILGARRRTVSKHLERVFAKLGVETRTAAAVRALEALGRPARER
jgi:DNA-binding CsgD family transcriptional regulator